MTLNEQWLKKHKRIYYHGFEKNYDDALRNFKNEFYLTTKIDYAISYAQRGGRITFNLDPSSNLASTIG